MATMTSKQRMLAAITRNETPDRLPVTTHHVMSYWLDRTMGGMSIPEFFKYFDLDPIVWTVPHKPDPSKGEYADPEQKPLGFLESTRIATDNWRVHWELIPDSRYETVRYTFATPKGTLTMVLQSDATTSWISEYLIKDPKDIDLLAEYMTAPTADVDAINQAAAEIGENGIVRGFICCFDVYGQPGCWQDAACLMGVENLIYATADDPEWVHELLRILQRRKRVYIESLEGARYDIVEFGGGAASSTVISPKLFDKFVAPYDSELIEVAHQAGQRVVYHTCGGMMPLLERIAAMKPDAMETLTPSAMGGDVNLAEVKRRIGDNVCLIGGFDQYHFFVGCTPEQTRIEVRRCFEAAGGNGGYIVCPSDHFFEAEPELLKAFVDEAHNCIYR